MDNKKPMSDQERLELASKLDKELDVFIDSLPRRKPEEIPSFERWEEEIASHPFFMKEPPKPGEKLHPLYEGLAKLKYDPEENPPEELATSYKDDGNFNFKHKKYRMAVISYMEGLKARSGNDELDATLYNNRAASHYHLKNYRSSLVDCENALKLNPNYSKALSRAANCCFQLEKFEKGVEFCDRILSADKNDKDIQELRTRCLNESKLKERNRRKREAVVRKLEKEEELIVGKILERGIKIQGGQNNLSLSGLEPQFPQLFDSRVHTDEEGSALIWPVIFFYPEYKLMDYIQHFHEENTFLEQLYQVFEYFPEWDRDKTYKPDDLSVYYEDERQRNVKVDVNSSLLRVLKSEGFVVKEGTPRFVILVRGSRVEKAFLEAS